MSCADKALAVIEFIGEGIIALLIMAALGAIIMIPGRLSDIADEIRMIQGRLSDIAEEIRKSTKEKRG